MSGALVGVLRKWIDDADAKEQIDGTTPTATAAMVSLDIAFSPVVVDRIGDWRYDIPKPVAVVKQGDKYRIDYPAARDFIFVSADNLKVVRARYLLLHGLYYRKFRSFSYPDQQKILAYYFPDGMVRIPALEETI